MRGFKQFLGEGKKLKISSTYWNKLSQTDKDVFQQLFYGYEYSEVNTIKSFITAIKKKFGDLGSVQVVNPHTVKSNGKDWTYSPDLKHWR